MSRMPEGPERSMPFGEDGCDRDVPDKLEFERVLRETLNRSGSLAQEQSVQIDSLIDLARHYLGMPFQQEPMARQLIGLILQGQFPGLSASSEFWDCVSKEIASILMDDPHQNRLLHQFWVSLSERAA